MGAEFRSRQSSKIATSIKFNWLNPMGTTGNNMMKGELLRSGQLATRSTIASSLSLIGIKKVSSRRYLEPKKELDRIIKEIEQGVPCPQLMAEK
jgi:hypothetical protein